MEINSFSKKPINFKLINELFKNSFNRELDEKYWKWRFFNNPISKKVYINYIIDSGTLIAYYAVSPCEISIDGEIYKIALSNMTMTHPEHAGKGCFRQLAMTMYEELIKDGFIGVFGFANANSHYGFKKNLNWKDLNSLNILSLDKKDFRKSALINKYNIKSNQISNDDILELNDLNCTKKPIKLGRSNEWLNWRLIEHPNNNYSILKIYYKTKLTGAIIYKNYLENVDLVELFFQERTDKYEIMSVAFNYLFSTEVNQLNCWGNLYAEEYGIMEKMRFRERAFNTYFGVIPFGKIDNLVDIKNWHFSFIDSDVF